MQIQQRVVGDVTILDLTGKLALFEGDQTLRDKVSTLLDRGCGRIVLNLDAVPYVDSAGLGEIVRTLLRVNARNRLGSRHRRTLRRELHVAGDVTGTQGENDQRLHRNACARGQG
jgi:anti-anti-sigma factor